MCRRKQFIHINALEIALRSVAHKSLSCYYTLNWNVRPYDFYLSLNPVFNRLEERKNVTPHSGIILSKCPRAIKCTFIVHRHTHTYTYIYIYILFSVIARTILTSSDELLMARVMIDNVALTGRTSTRG